MFNGFNLKAVFENKKFLIYFLSSLLIAIISLTSYVGYNEYSYRKIGVCFTENNYNLAEYYIDSMSPGYKDVEKIKSLVHTVKNFDQTNLNDYKRVLSMLDSYKGFSNVNVNHFYNSFYHNILKLNSIHTTAVSSDDKPDTTAYAVTFPFENTTIPSPQTGNVQPTTGTQASDDFIVYYVESGEVYHINSNCRSLSSANKILSGPVPDGRRVCKVCGEG